MSLPRDTKPIKSVLKGLALLAILGVSVYLLRSAGLIDTLDTRWVDARIRGHGVSGAMLYIAVAGFFIALGAPRQLLCFLGGYAFGFAWGALLAAMASGLGCLVATVTARLLGRDVVVRYLGRRVRQLDDFVGARPFATAVTIRFLPVGSNLFTNLAAGVSRIPLWPFVLGSLVGYLPQTVVFALFGGGVNVSSTVQIALSVVLFLISAAMGVALYRRRRAERR
ncbi:MAG: TVP38/TMEM64 family protein [Desulfovibrionaceae bacterium]